LTASGDVARRVVVALGGNALIREGQSGSYEEQEKNAAQTASAIKDVLAAGCSVVVTHGNGPQVGALAIQQEEGASFVPAQPLPALGAMTQGLLGHILELCLAAITDVPTACVVTHVTVDASDPGFSDRTKPIGPFFPKDRAEQLARERGWTIGEDARRGYRRLVASPEPIEILEAGAIRVLIDEGYLVIAAGGGGIPVIRQRRRLAVVDAVIDKDLSAQRLATGIGADTLLLLTGVDRVALNYDTPDMQELSRVRVEEAEAYLQQGQFPPGSMGPKVAAAIRFLQEGGQMGIITSPSQARAAITGDAGTRIVKQGRSAKGEFLR
jgi:carbamate kinase